MAQGSRRTSGRLRAAGAVLIASLAGCALHPPVPLARVRMGPARTTAPRTVLALPASCQPASDYCSRVQAVHAATRMSLQFAGYRVVDRELVNLHARKRVERTHRGADVDTRQVDVGEAAWTEESAARWTALLQEMGVDAVLLTTLAIDPTGMAGEQLVQVRVSLARLADGALIWSSHCGVSAGVYYTLDQAVERATRCSLDGAEVVGAS